MKIKCQSRRRLRFENTLSRCELSPMLICRAQLPQFIRNYVVIIQAAKDEDTIADEDHFVHCQLADRIICDRAAFRSEGLT